MTMKEMKQWLMVAAVIALCGMMTGCKGNAQRPVNGTMEEAVAPGDAPQAVADLMKQVNIDDRYETLMEDKTNGVSVWSLLNCGDTISSEGYGIVVGKGDVKTALPNLRHGRMPRARYDAATGDLLIESIIPGDIVFLSSNVVSGGYEAALCTDTGTLLMRSSVGTTIRLREFTADSDIASRIVSVRRVFSD